jgi:hypothetical protein
VKSSGREAATVVVSHFQPCLPQLLFPMRPFSALSVLVLAALAAGCVTRTAPRYTSLGDGVYKSPTAQDAENYCRNFGAPMRYLANRGAEDQAQGVPAGEVVYRCD